jgi:hypothetical protein
MLTAEQQQLRERGLARSVWAYHALAEGRGQWAQYPIVKRTRARLFIAVSAPPEDRGDPEGSPAAAVPLVTVSLERAQWNERGYADTGLFACLSGRFYMQRVNEPRPVLPAATADPVSMARVPGIYWRLSWERYRDQTVTEALARALAASGDETPPEAAAAWCRQQSPAPYSAARTLAGARWEAGHRDADPEAAAARQAEFAAVVAALAAAWRQERV